MRFEKPDAWRIVQPAPRVAVLELGGSVARIRRHVLAQVRAHESAAVYLGDAEMAVAMFGRHGWRRLEMALAIAPAARPHMRRLVRIAQLTLDGLAETHLVVAHVHPANAAGARMAALVGFRPARLNRAGLWVYRRERDDNDLRRRQQGGQEGGGGKSPDPGGGQ